MKLLFDQNISFRIVSKLDDRFLGSKQVRHVGLEDSPDSLIWTYAKKEQFSIVTYDSDFYDIALMNGFPPKIIWLRKGNMTTVQIADHLQSLFVVIQNFIQDVNQACLEIE